MPRNKERASLKGPNFEARVHAGRGEGRGARKGLKFSAPRFSPKRFFSYRKGGKEENGNRDRIFMMALDGRHEVKYARYLNLLLSCRGERTREGIYRACDRARCFYCCPVSRGSALRRREKVTLNVYWGIIPRIETTIAGASKSLDTSHTSLVQHKSILPRGRQDLAGTLL